MKNIIGTVFVLFLLSTSIHAQISLSEFANPSKRSRPIPLWFWNNTTINETELLDQFRQMIEKDNYGGCAVLPFGKNFKPVYLSTEYFNLYGKLLEEAKRQSVHLSVYDEFGFPSGSMGAHADGVPRFMSIYPDATIKRLDKIEYAVSTGIKFKQAVPAGKLMSVVAMDTLTQKRISLRNHIHAGILDWDVPEGSWKIMFFVCVKDGSPLVDYLDPESVKLFVKETHQAYYDRFSSYFGNVIIQTFFDEPTLYRGNGRIWTDLFNEKFSDRYGYSPDLLYPALWYDIGVDTQSARNHLFGFRATLYSEGFMKVIQEWSSTHNIYSTGHQDQEELLNPVSLSGDLMLCGKYMDIPGIDKIGGNRPAEHFYKVISSSAYNWDKRQVMSETFGAMGNLTMQELYHISMEQYAKGINMLIPHAVWYNDKDVTFLPELSWRNSLYKDGLPAFNQFLSRLNYVLQQEGRHVADIALIYPIETLQGEHVLDGSLGFYKGGIEIPNTDYAHISALLTDKLGRDFTYLHPEVLATKCKVGNGLLHLTNAINHETFQLVIIPGMKTISVSNMRIIEKFYRAGGSVLFTTKLPSKSVEPGKDQEVQRIIKRLFAKQHKAGGKVFFVEFPEQIALGEKIQMCIINPDVYFPQGYELNYIHKVIKGKHVYYFANLKDNPYCAEVVVQGKIEPLLLDPHTGKYSEVKYQHSQTNEVEKTLIQLPIKGTSSIFIIEK